MDSCARRALIGLVLGALAFGGAVAEDAATGTTNWAAGWAALEAGNGAGAALAWRARAEAGDVDLQFNIGVLYEAGALGAPDPATAARWYRRAAEHGLGAAAVRLAGLTARGAERDAAIANLRLAADAGSGEARAVLGAIYENGAGVAPDAARALALYRQAADQGDARGAYALGRAYAKGLGLARNSAEAVRWYRIAADAGVPEAQNNLGRHYELGDGVTRDPAVAATWYRRAAESGLAVARVNLGIAHALGIGVARDEDEAARWFRLAAWQGDGAARVRLGLAYANGQGVARDETLAYAWFDMAIRTADVEAATEAARYMNQLAREFAPAELDLAQARAGDLWLVVRGIAQPANPALLRGPEGFGPLIAAQRGLALLGYYQGAVDGIAGPGTTQGVRAFQHDAGLGVDGQITAALIGALRDAAQTRGMPWPESRSPI